MTMRRWLGVMVVMVGACRPDSVAERSAMLPALCEVYCPLRVACVDDGWAGGDVEACTRMCVGEERYVLAGACGEASFAALECLAALECAALPVATAALAHSDEAADCYAEQQEQQDLCGFWIER